jgi:uncharacterized protein YggU (UPF0235/DUF167 family)
MNISGKAVRLTPGTRRNQIMGTLSDQGGTTRLRVSVSAIPENGKANRALILLLSKAWRLPKSSFSISSGAGSKQKTVQISGDPDHLLERIHHGEDK